MAQVVLQQHSSFVRKGPHLAEVGRWLLLDLMRKPSWKISVQYEKEQSDTVANQSGVGSEMWSMIIILTDPGPLSTRIPSCSFNA